MNTELPILTPEKAVITYRQASLGGRITAHLLDIIIVIALLYGVTLAIFFLSIYVPIFLTVLQPLIFFLLFIYFIAFEGLWNGQTPGKRLFKIRVRMADGTPIIFSAAIGRNLLRIADFLPSFYCAGIIATFVNPKNQRLGDLVANTVVVYEGTSSTLRFYSAPHHVGQHPYEEYVGDLRGMTLAEYQVLRKLCDRFPELGSSVQEKMLREVWEPLSAKRGIRPISGVHPLYLAEATVMKYGRRQGLL